MFDENEIRMALKHEIEITSIRENPKEYMLTFCYELEKIYKTDQDNFNIVHGFRLAIEGHAWVEIDKKIWKHSSDNNASMTFVSRKLARFEKIATANSMPFIGAKRLKSMEESDKESIADEMIRQLEAFQADG